MTCNLRQIVDEVRERVNNIGEKGLKAGPYDCERLHKHAKHLQAYRRGEEHHLCTVTFTIHGNLFEHKTRNKADEITMQIIGLSIISHLLQNQSYIQNFPDGNGLFIENKRAYKTDLQSLRETLGSHGPQSKELLTRMWAKAEGEPYRFILVVYENQNILSDGDLISNANGRMAVLVDVITPRSMYHYFCIQ